MVVFTVICMSKEFELVIRTLLVGAGATAAMDVWSLLLQRVGIRSLDYAMLGRWIGHLPSGTFKHENIATAPAVRHERAMGWCAHYGIGITFAALLVWIGGLEWARAPTLLPALATGLLTVVVPFFVLQPALGAGIAASRTPNPNLARTLTILIHMVYGFGLYGSAKLWAMLIR
jgi:hypothetical protein